MFTETSTVIAHPLRARTGRLALLAALVLPATAFAAGLEIPENGSLVLARGGTAVAMDGTAYGVEFNPATLSDINMLDVRVDLRLVNNTITFTRFTNSKLPNPPAGGFASVSNSAGVFAAPGVYMGYHPKNWPVAFGAGVFGPPGDGNYSYPDPRQLTAGSNGVSYAQADAQSGQRYTLINSNATILLPTISVSWRILPEVAIGLSVQAASAHVMQSNAVAAGSNGGYESVDSDAYAQLDVRGFSGPILVPGVLMTLMPGLWLGAQYRPSYTLNMSGSLNVSELTSPAASCPSTPICQNTSAVGLQMTQPDETRFGLSFDRGRWSGEIDGVLEDWSAYNVLILNASKINVTSPTSPSPGLNLGTQTISKDWVDAWSVRLGASYKAIEASTNKRGIGLQVHLGGLYESNAIPNQYVGVDTATGDRWGLSGGVTGTWHGFGITAAFMGYMAQTLVVESSNVDRGVSGVLNNDVTVNTDPTPVRIGNGIYHIGLWVASIGLSYSG